MEPGPIAQFVALLETSAFSPVRCIQFVVHGFLFRFEGSARRAREQFEPLLRAAIPSRDGREILCLDGEDIA